MRHCVFCKINSVFEGDIGIDEFLHVRSIIWRDMFPQLAVGRFREACHGPHRTPFWEQQQQNGRKITKVSSSKTLMLIAV